MKYLALPAVLLASSLLVACPNDSEPKGESSSGGATSGTVVSTAGGTVSVSIPANTRTCAGAVCGNQSNCCTTTGACGMVAPTNVFVVACLNAVTRGGTRDDACPAVEYCDTRKCQTFAGCRTTEQACGYWVDRYQLFSGEMMIEVTANLGCLAASEFVAK